MKARKTIFGFGSLISTKSIHVTAPDATDIRPAYIKGFKRSFNFWDAIGFTESNLDLAGEPMCALDIAPISDAEARVNGVIFTVDEADYERLLIREAGYDLIKTSAHDYFTDELLAEDCLVFSANKNNGKYVHDGKAQRRYLDDYLEGAKQYGDRYYQEILNTTYVGDEVLSKLGQLYS